MDTGKIKVILDTDISGDVDDVGALAVLNSFVLEEKVEMLAVVCDVSNPFCVPCAEAINLYFGNGNVEYGTLKRRDDLYPQETTYNRYIAEHYPHSMREGEADDAVTAYRRILAAQSDGSVTIISIGTLTNLSDLLDSQPDAFSPLDGHTLVKKKVRLLSCMGGIVPEGKEFNIMIDPAASMNVTAGWPTPIVFTDFTLGEDVFTGNKCADFPMNSPVRVAYEKYFEFWKADCRPSWDLIAALYAVNGKGDLFELHPCDICVFPDGRNIFTDNPAGKHAYLSSRVSSQQLADVLNGLMRRAEMLRAAND